MCQDAHVSFDELTRSITISLEQTKRDTDGYSVTYDAVEIVGVELIIKNPDGPFNQFALVSIVLKSTAINFAGVLPYEKAKKLRKDVFLARARVGVIDRERM